MSQRQKSKNRRSTPAAFKGEGHVIEQTNFKSGVLLHYELETLLKQIDTFKRRFLFGRASSNLKYVVSHHFAYRLTNLERQRLAEQLDALQTSLMFMDDQIDLAEFEKSVLAFS